MEIHPLGAELFRADEQTNKKKLRGGLSLQICVFFGNYSYHTSVSINAFLEVPV